MLTNASGATPLVLPDATIEQLGERYLALPAVWRAQLTFESFILRRLQIRNGTAFEKLRHRRSLRNSRSTFRKREEAQ